MKYFWIICFLLIATISNAAEVTLAWNANTEEDLAGYRIYYRFDGHGAPYGGTGIDQGNSPINIPVADLSDSNNPQITLTGLVTNTYRFAATAYDKNGNESGYSNEVEYLVDLRNPDAPTELVAEYDSEAKQVMLTWKQSEEVSTDYWQIYYRISGDWIELDRVEYSDTPSLTAPLTVVAEGEDEAVEFVVVAFRDNGQHSADSNIAAVRIDRMPPPPPVLTIQVKIPIE